MPSDEMVEKARKIADEMFFGEHKPECEVPLDQTMQVRYGLAIDRIAAALTAAMGEEKPVAWIIHDKPELRGDYLSWSKNVAVVCDVPATPLFTHPPREDVVEECAKAVEALAHSFAGPFAADPEDYIRADAFAEAAAAIRKLAEK
jgi:hypothetical protein